MHNPGLLSAELHLTSLGGGHGALHIHGDGAELRVRHKATRAEHLTKPAHQAHHVRRRDAAIKLDLAFLHQGSQVIRTHHIRTGGLGFISLGATGENANTHGLAGAMGQAHHAAHHLVRMAGVNAEVHRNFNGFVKLRLGPALGDLHRLIQRVSLFAVNARIGCLQALTLLCHDLSPPPRSGPWRGRNPRACARQRQRHWRSCAASSPWRFQPAATS